MGRLGLVIAVVFVSLGVLLIGRKVVMSEAVITKIAQAIAYAEGFYVKGSVPNRLNNPGDLERDITGRGIGKEGPYIKYAKLEDGWDALKKQVRLMFGGSAIYNPDMSIVDVARHYTATEQDAWAANVASKLGVKPSTKLSEINA